MAGFALNANIIYQLNFTLEKPDEKLIVITVISFFGD